MIAGYEVLGELGRGGMGIVYKARQHGLNRLVALKMILHADHASETERRRFLHEAEALARLQHENIVQIHEVGEHHGKPFFSLEYIEGGSLAQLLQGTPFPAHEAAALVLTLAGAMQAAHEAGVIHRDLKPANILLARGGADASAGTLPEGSRLPVSAITPKITDFGLAKDVAQASQTQSGAILGTPSYMAPEQAGGKVHAIDARTDIYALGAILYECLTGRPPFRAATVMDTIQQVIHDEPVSVRTLQAGTPVDLETICLKCLHKEPGRRYGTARELADDLSRFRRGEPVAARPVGRLERTWRWCRRNPTTAGLLTGIAALLLLVAGVSTALGQLAWQKAREAETKTEDERRARMKAIEEALEKEEARKKADEEERRAKQLLYANRLALTQSYWDEGKVQAARDKLDETPEHREDWEHRYLYTMMNQRGQRTFLGHTWRVYSVCFSPDGKRLASGGATPFRQGELKVWDTATGEELLSSQGHANAVQCVCFSPDGKRFASGGGDGTVKVWDTATGQNLLTLPGDLSTVFSVCYSADGRIASGNQAGRVRVWDARSGQLLHNIVAHTNHVLGVCFSPDGKRLASASADDTVKVMDVASGQQLLVLKGHTGPVASVCFSPDGKRLATGSEDQTVRLWDATTGQDLLSLKGHSLNVTSVRFSPDGRRLASGSWDRTLKVWDAASGQQLLSLIGHTTTVQSVAFSPDGRRLASASTDMTVKMWDAVAGQDLLTLKGHTHTVHGVCFSPDGKTLASASWDKTVKVWDAANGQQLRTLSGHTNLVSRLSFSPDGKRLVSASGDIFGKPGEVKVWDTTNGQDLLTIKEPRSIFGVSFSPDGKCIASTSGDRTARVWDATTGQVLLTLQGHGGGLCGLCYSPDGKRIASSGLDQTVKVWDAATGQDCLTLKGHTGMVMSVCFSPDSRRLASTSGDRTIIVWDADSGENLLTLRGHAHTITSVCFSPDGKRIASGSGDQEVKIWDAQSGQDLLSLKGHIGGVTSVAFSPDGRRLASAGADRTVKLWEATTGQELPSLRAAAYVGLVGFSADSRRLISTDANEKQLTWDFITGKVLADTSQPVNSSRRSPDGRFFALVEDMVIRVHRLPAGTPEERAEGRRWVDPDFRWHEAQAREAWQDADWFAADFHLGRLQRKRPRDASVHVQRAHALRQLGRQTEAATHTLWAILLDPQVSWAVPPSKPRPVMPRVQGND
jgi:WD40 repeat protein/tRNA A-37 threonylcarbamoyl transferase component Bud32